VIQKFIVMPECSIYLNDPAEVPEDELLNEAQVPVNKI
jgi:effector-binding domain-containing protein